MSCTQTQIGRCGRLMLGGFVLSMKTQTMSIRCYCEKFPVTLRSQRSFENGDENGLNLSCNKFVSGLICNIFTIGFDNI